MRKQTFPNEWKTARSVLIPKKGKDPAQSNSYSPLCLLNIISKMYESLIWARLDSELDKKEQLREATVRFPQRSFSSASYEASTRRGRKDGEGVARPNHTRCEKLFQQGHLGADPPEAGGSRDVPIPDQYRLANISDRFKTKSSRMRTSCGLPHASGQGVERLTHRDRKETPWSDTLMIWRWSRIP